MDLSQITDIHLYENAPEKSIVFPGPISVSAAGIELAKTLIERCRACRKTDFMVTLDGVFFRGRKEACAVDGAWYSLRRMPSDPPNLDALPSRMSASIKKMLLSPTLSAGGLVCVIGSPGAGKTTTASATLVSRLHAYGGFAYTIEDPPEMPLNGWHGQGYCRQTWVSGDNESNWAESMRGVLRSQPANTPVILLVGEVRDQESARAMLRAAANGFLVIATSFGTDIPSGIDALIRLTGGTEGDLSSLASVLRLVLHQRLRDGIMATQFLVSREPSSPVAIKLRAGQYNHLVSDIQFQANRAMLGEEVL